MSNFTKARFRFDEVECGSMEGFIQSLKEEDPAEAAKIALLSGMKAKRTAAERMTKVLSLNRVWWKGNAIVFRSREHFDLIEGALVEKFRSNPEMREALIRTGDAVFTHETGVPEGPETSYPAIEFIEAMYRVRALMTKEQFLP